MSRKKLLSNEPKNAYAVLVDGTQFGDIYSTVESALKAGLGYQWLAENCVQIVQVLKELEPY